RRHLGSHTRSGELSETWQHRGQILVDHGPASAEPHGPTQLESAGVEHVRHAESVVGRAELTELGVDRVDRQPVAGDVAPHLGMTPIPDRPERDCSVNPPDHSSMLLTLLCPAVTWTVAQG